MQKVEKGYISIPQAVANPGFVDGGPKEFFY
jgi:hypothetical protein